jgi:hypothetical protein
MGAQLHLRLGLRELGGFRNISTVIGDVPSNQGCRVEKEEIGGNPRQSPGFQPPMAEMERDIGRYL